LDANILLLASQVNDRQRSTQRDPPLELKLISCVYGVLSPLLSNILLTDLDRELERRGLAFVRYADDCNVYVRSRRAGERIMGGSRRS